MRACCEVSGAGDVLGCGGVDWGEVPGMSYQIQIYVDEVRYAGDDIGDDFRFDFVVDGRPSSFSRSIAHGSTWDTFTKIFTGTFDGDWDIPISVTVTEEDMLFDDVGFASPALTIDWRIQRQARNRIARHSYFVPHGITSETHSFTVTVVGSGWDEQGLAAKLTIKLKAIMRPCEAGGDRIGAETDG